MSVGIEKIGVYPCTASLSMASLSAARGADPRHVREEMLIDERSVSPPWEDPVTMATNAALSMLTDADREAIELLIVCSESGVDQEKPMSTWVHRYLGLSPNCRNFEAKHACYSGTAALKLAAAWIGSPGARGKKALVITTDQSRMHLGQPWEYVMGAGGCALLVSDTPEFLELELERFGIYTEEVSDLTRPTSTVETGNSELSLVSYLNAMEETCDDFVRRSGGAVDFDSEFRWNVYHVPFGGLTFRAHRSLLRRSGIRDRATAWRHFEQRSLPALSYNRRMGGTYAAATFVALIGLVDNATGLEPGDSVSIFSYGSGCCSEFYGARIGARAREVAENAGVRSALNSRYALDVDQYESIERERTGYIDVGDYEPPLDSVRELYESHYAGRRRLLFRGLSKHVRRYAWS